MQGDESDRDSPLVGAIQHIYDIRVVRPSEASGDEGLDELAAHSGHPLLLGTGVFEYCAQVPANRLGFTGNGGPFSLMQLKVIQEVVSLIVFTLVVTLLFKGEALHWNHIAAFVCLVLAVFFVFLK